LIWRWFPTNAPEGRERVGTPVGGKTIGDKMLKPKRKISKKEIQRDPFLESIFSIKTHLTEKKQYYTRIILAVLAVFIMGSFYLKSQDSNRETAENILSKAMVFIALNDEDNAMIHLQEVIDEFENTVAGRNASFYIGRIYLDKGEYDLALPHFERYAAKGRNPILTGSVYQAMVNIYRSKQDLSNAIKFQKMSIKHSNSKEEKAWASLTLADLSLANGDKIAALELVKRVIVDFKNNNGLRQRADEITGRIGS
jgi:tetratricopeptide (TPR) repeat protein